MPKKKPSHSSRPTPARRLVERTQEAVDLLTEGETEKALAILEELDQAYPNTPEVLADLADAFADLKDFHGYEGAIRRIARLDPRNAEIQYALAGAYMANQRPALALRTFQDALRRWPAHRHAAEARAELPRLEEILRSMAAETGMELDQVMDLMSMHDELRCCLAHAEYRQGRQVAEKLLRDFPGYVPALNNLSQIYSVEGDFDQAIRTALRVLETEPENVHALSNVARLHFLLGRPQEAARFADRLKRSTDPATDRWTKIAEALTFLEDDRGVLGLYDRAKAAHETEPPFVDDIFYHLLGAAAAHLGKPGDARKYWKKSLQINPNFAWPKQNLADLDLPVDQRAGPWAYPFENWLIGARLQDMQQEVQKLGRAAKQSDVQPALARLLEEKYPEILFLAPHLVARGDAKARDFVVRVAALTALPALVDAAKGYAFGQLGAFDDRFEATRILTEAGLLLSGPVRMWKEGEWRQMLMLNMEISPEARPTGWPRQVDALARRGFQAMQSKDFPSAAAAFEKAVALWPKDPTLRYNLAMAHGIQGDEERAEQMVRDIQAQFPDYFFGILNMANQAALAGDYEQAHTLLTGLLQRKQLHQSEFTALCRAQIQLSLAEGKPENVSSWLDMWERVDPENPDLSLYRRRAKLK